MSNVLIVAREVAVLFLLMGVGAIVRRRKMLGETGIAGVTNVLVKIVTPCVIIDAFRRPFDHSMLAQLGVACLVAALAHAIGIALSYACVHHPNVETRKPLRLAAVFSNAGFMGLPLEQAILGDIGVFFGIMYVVVFNFFIWSWGYGVMRRAGEKADCTLMYVNPGTIGLAVALPIFLFSLHVPHCLAEPIHHLANLNTPLAMIVIGYSLAGARFLRVLKTPAVYVACVIRLVATPLAVVGLLWLARGHLNRDMMLAVTIGAAAPVAAMVSIFAAQFRRDLDMAVAIVSGTTLLSIVTMPPIIALAMALYL